MLNSTWKQADKLSEINVLIENAQSEFRERLIAYLEDNADRRDAYQRYLTFQYHMTKGVQSYFFRVAASPKLSKKRALRQFFVQFANEEELHYLVAASDLGAMGLEVMPEPFDVTLWHAYFNAIVDERPFVRVGAALILENISDGKAREAVQKALSDDFLNRANTKFLVLHMHETLPHGEQLMEALTSVQLEDADIDDLILGAKQGTILYLRMVDWALGLDKLSRETFDQEFSLSKREQEDIANFHMADLEL